MSPVNGNDYVGVGELNPSRPKPFFWHDPTLHPYGDMQHYTLRVMFGLPDAGPIWQAFAMSEEPGKFQQRASRTMRSFRCSEISRCISATPLGRQKFSVMQSAAILTKTSTTSR